MRSALSHLKELGITARGRLATGSSLTTSAQEVQRRQHLSIIARRPRPFWSRIVRRNPLHSVLAQIHTPLLIVSGPHRRLERILVCLDGLGYATIAAQVAMEIAARAGASLTLLHVVEPSSYQYLPSETVPKRWDELVDLAYPHAPALQKAAEMAREVDPHAQLKLRRGFVVHEISQELRGGDYQLVAMGSHLSSQSLRQRFAPDVTVEISHLAICAQLVAEKPFGL